MTRNSFARLAIIASLLGALTHQAPAEEPEAEKFCGPRCVHFFLAKYSSSEVPPLTELVRELQWPRTNDGTSLTDIAKYLKNSGLYVQPATLHSPRSISELRNCEAIVHLANNDGVGHFLVVVEARPSEIVCWDGLKGIEGIDPSYLSGRMSGNILLVSPEPINFNNAFEDPNPWNPWLSASLVSGVIAAFFFITSHRRKR